MVSIEKQKTVALSGHRILPKSFNYAKLEELLFYLVKDGYNTFLCGMAIGFDTEAFKVLEKLRKENSIKIIACVPCNNQDRGFNKAQKQEYDRLIKSADEVIVLQDKYDVYCMKKRNCFMVDNASVLLCYLTQSKGGTYQTVTYAIENKVDVLYVK